MTKKDFEKIAKTVREAKSRFTSNTAHALFAADMADMLAEDNERFDRPRFIMACMPKVWVGSPNANAWERTARKAAR